MNSKSKSDRSSRIDQKVTRRQFLGRVGALVGGAAVTSVTAACTTMPIAGAPTTASPSIPAPTTAPAVIGPRTGGRLTWGIENDITNMIPFGEIGESHWGKEHVYESLVQWDRGLMVQPALAVSWETPDEKSWVFHLREGVTWHNGEEFTADDVKYSMDLQREPPAPGIANAHYPRIEDIEIVDKYTVKFNMAGPDPTVLGYFAWGRYSPIIPKDAYDRWNVLSEAVGSNMFKLLSYVSNDRLEYARFDDYWDPKLPYLDELVIKILTDENARVAALRAGAIDGCYLAPDSAKMLENDPDITILKGLYSAPRVMEFTLKNEGKPWEDKRVRQAISRAINREEIIEKVFANEAVLSGPIPPGYGDWFIPPEELADEWLYHDLDEAKSLMAEAGYKDGFKVTAHAIANRDVTTIAEVFQSQLKAINIDVTVISEEIGSFGKRIGDAAFEWSFTPRGMRHDPVGYLVDFCRTDQGIYANWFNKGQGYRNEESSELFEQMSVNLDDKSRHEQVRRIQENVLDDVPHVYICQPYWFHGIHNYVKDMYAAYTNFYPGLRSAWLDE